MDDVQLITSTFPCMEWVAWGPYLQAEYKCQVWRSKSNRWVSLFLPLFCRDCHSFLSPCLIHMYCFSFILFCITMMFFIERMMKPFLQKPVSLNSDMVKNLNPHEHRWSSRQHLSSRQVTLCKDFWKILKMQR